MARLATATALVALVLLFPPAAAWSHYHGGPDRNGLAALPGGRLDVLTNTTLGTDVFLEPFWGAASLSFEGALVTVVRGEDGCALRLSSFPTLDAVHEMPLEWCVGATLVGISAEGLALVCNDVWGEEPFLHAYDLRTGKEAWAVTGDAITDLPPAGSYVTCLSTAIDDATGTVYVPLLAGSTGRTPVSGAAFSGGVYTTARVAALELATGRAEWVAPLQLASQLDLPGSNAPDAQALTPIGVTLTTTGVVVTGYTNCPAVEFLGTSPAPACQEAFLAWFGRDGTFHGVERASTGKTDAFAQVERRRAASQYAIARGPLAVAAIGNEVVVVNPEADATVLRAPLEGAEPPTSFVFWPAGSWTDRALILGLPHSLAAFDPETLEPRWTWTESLDVEVKDLLVTPTGIAYVLTHQRATNAVHLVALASEDGTLLSRTPLRLSLTDVEQGFWFAHLAVVEDQGIVLVDSQARAMAVGPKGASALSLRDAYPPLDLPVAFDLPANDGAREYVVSWGDGSVESFSPGEAAEHAYVERGDYDIATTSIRADGTTETAVATVHVGGTRPPELTAMQKAFAPENQNLTFGVLGIGITILGAMITLGRQRRRFSRLERELGAVEEIRMLSIDDPLSAVLALKDYRDRLPEDLVRRRIDDAQFGILDQRSARLLKVLRTRLFAPYDARLSPRFHRLLDAAFEDAILQQSEREVLVEALGEEQAFSEAERDAIRRTLAAFTSERTDVRLRTPRRDAAFHNNS